jgi:MoaA/NifB/PqqE/SkfB family radical SAM enzyme
MMAIKSPPVPTIIDEERKERNHSNHLNNSLKIFFKDALRITVRNPLQAYHFFRTIRWQQKATRIRSNWKQQGIHVPPIIIFSITDKCNLHCKGCYAQAIHKPPETELSTEELGNIIGEAKELGSSFFVLAGGEPFVRSEILEITKQFPEILFLVFTNGMLIDDEMIKKLKKQKNVVPVISLEGYEEDTDQRRGTGVYKHLQGIIQKIKNKGIFWAVSLTITKSNFDTVLLFGI